MTYPADIQKAASDAIYSFTADGNFSPNQMMGAFCEAIARERERCALVALAASSGGDFVMTGPAGLCLRIAAAIRSPESVGE